MGAFLTAFPDMHVTTDQVITEGDTVIYRGTVRGTHTGDFNGIPPTGKQFTLEGIDILRLADGKIQEIWVAYDMLSLLQHLGVIPQPEAATV